AHLRSWVQSANWMVADLFETGLSGPLIWSAVARCAGGPCHRAVALQERRQVQGSIGGAHASGSKRRGGARPTDDRDTRSGNAVRRGLPALHPPRTMPTADASAASRMKFYFRGTTGSVRTDIRSVRVPVPLNRDAGSVGPPW